MIEVTTIWYYVDYLLYKMNAVYVRLFENKQIIFKNFFFQLTKNQKTGLKVTYAFRWVSINVKKMPYFWNEGYGKDWV